jgi:cobalt/nickel transport system permease protein
MHIPDGFIDGPTSAAGAVASVGLVAASVRRAGVDLDERKIPLAGLTAAYVFSLQMLNFPVANGTSGHILGGCLAAVLVGPWVATLCMTVVLGVQALVFADGGVSALGLNVLAMSYAACLGGYAVFLAVRRLLPATREAIVASSAIAAWFSVVTAATVFSVYYAIGGNGGIDPETVATAMLGVHALIGIGEAVITGLTVAAVVAARPDLVAGAGARLRLTTPLTVGGRQ